MSIHHTEADFAPIVAAYIRKQGCGYWSDIFRHVENVVPLSDYDLVQYNNRTTRRFESHIHNLKCNGLFEQEYSDIIRISGGFAVAKFAADNGIEEEDITTAQRRRRRVIPKNIIDNRTGERYIRAVYKERIPELKVFPRVEVYADFKSLTVNEFGIKYFGLTPTI